MQDLGIVEMNSENTMNEQAAEIAALKETMAAKDLGWEQERQKMMKALRSEREGRKLARADKTAAEKEKVEIIRSLRESLSEKQSESAKFNRVVETMTEENETFRKNCVKKANHVMFGLEKMDVMDLDAKLLALQNRQDNFEKMVRQTVMDMESQATQKDGEHIRSEVEWKIKLRALEDQMRCELAAKEENFQKEKELQIRSRETEEEWRKQKEEEVKLLIQQNADLQLENISLQKLAQLTDKEKAQLKKEEKKARKEAEKILKKDQKEEEEREKKEKKEREEREKKEKKEREEREKKEKKEREKREKKELKEQKKERKENEKRQKGELKRQKKENVLMYRVVEERM